jgi:vacuolar-type H+-ATPase subunit E/Vma4
MNVEKKLSSLKDYIKSKSRVEAEKLLKEAEKRANEIEKEYNRKAEENYSHILEEAKNNVSLFERREKAQSIAKSSKMLLDAKNEIMKSALKELEDATYALNSSKKYTLLFEKLFKEAVESLNEEEIVVHFRKEDKELASKLASKMEKELNKTIILSKNYVNIKGGVIVSTKDERIVIENTLESKFEEMKENFLNLLFSRLNVNG